MRSSKLYILLILLFLPAVAISQFGGDRSDYYDFGRDFFCEIYSSPADNLDSINITAVFRIAYNRLPFVKAPLNKRKKGDYYSVPSLEISFRDKNGIIRGRMIWNDTVFTNDFEKTKSKTDFVYGTLSTTLINCEYTPNIELADDSRKSLGRLKLSTILPRKFLQEMCYSQPIFTHLTASERFFKPFVIDSSIRYNANGAFLFLVSSYKKEITSFEYSYEYIAPSPGLNIQWNREIQHNGITNIIPNKILRVSNQSNQDSIILKLMDFTSTDTDELSLGLIKIEIPPSHLVPGIYRLSINQSGSKDTTHIGFGVYWEQMPISLRNPQYAMDIMYYVLTDEEHSTMRRGSNQDIFNKMLEYWTQHDPTPFTNYNEAKSEFFARVDFANFNFRTLAEKEGAKTERGKIYILYGLPDETQIIPTPGGSQEIWYYNRLSKQFIFDILSSGRYKLIEIR